MSKFINRNKQDYEEEEDIKIIPEFNYLELQNIVITRLRELNSVFSNPLAQTTQEIDIPDILEPAYDIVGVNIESGKILLFIFDGIKNVLQAPSSKKAVSKFIKDNLLGELSLYLDERTYSSLPNRLPDLLEVRNTEDLKIYTFPEIKLDINSSFWREIFEAIYETRVSSEIQNPSENRKVPKAVMFINGTSPYDFSKVYKLSTDYRRSTKFPEYSNRPRLRPQFSITQIPSYAKIYQNPEEGVSVLLTLSKLVDVLDFMFLSEETQLTSVANTLGYQISWGSKNYEVWKEIFLNLSIISQNKLTGLNFDVSDIWRMVVRHMNVKSEFYSKENESGGFIVPCFHSVNLANNIQSYNFIKMITEMALNSPIFPCDVSTATAAQVIVIGSFNAISHVDTLMEPIYDLVNERLKQDGIAKDIQISFSDYAGLNQNNTEVSVLILLINPQMEIFKGVFKNAFDFIIRNRDSEGLAIQTEFNYVKEDSLTARQIINLGKILDQPYPDDEKYFENFFIEQLGKISSE
ncbi:MAG: hypothetical protein INQ03_15735 [Candidatus Heimdallarchaeota archaeon]|nr:hypothetical protein [Candidatus Heimdallarchaeota archaeon]